MLNDLKQIIAIKSVSNSSENADRPTNGKTKNAPFGDGCRAALDWFLTTAGSYGMRVGEDDGYAAWAEIGKGERLIGVLAHLDTVPLGEGWTSPPLEMTIKDGKIYGRGAIDDKGAAVAVLHAMKQLLDEGVNLSARVRLIVGVSEERGSQCIKHYAENCEVPNVSFTPDAEFPVVCSEKGLCHIKVSFSAEQLLSDNILSYSGGESSNVVPRHSECTLSGELLKNLESVTLPQNIFRPFGREGVIEAKGIAAHASLPERGDSAIHRLAAFLSKALPSSPSLEYLAKLSAIDALERLGLAAEDEMSGRLTLCVVLVKFDSGAITAHLDVRLPLCTAPSDFMSGLNGTLPKGAAAELVSYAPNLYVDEKSPLISALLSVYKKHFGGNAEMSGNDAKPLKIGGGTYAKSLPNCVAFGPSPQGSDFHMHDADEYIPLDLFYKLKDIYKDAIIKLTNII